MVTPPGFDSAGLPAGNDNRGPRLQVYECRASCQLARIELKCSFFSQAGSLRHGSQGWRAEAGSFRGGALDAGENGWVGIKPARIDRLFADRTNSPGTFIHSLKRVI